MIMSASPLRSSRPPSVAGYQNSSPRLPSPLNPASGSFSPPLTSGHISCHSSVGEMSDTLSPLRERLDSGLTTSPRSSPAVARPRASSFTLSPHGTPPELSPVMGSIPLQSHHAYAYHPSPNNGLFVRGIPFPSSSSLSSPPLEGSTQFSVPLGQRPLSPSNGPLPAAINCTHSYFQSRPLRSPPQPAYSHDHPSCGSPVQIMPSPPARYHRTQSLIQQSCGNVQVPSSPSDATRNRHVSLGAEPRSYPSTPGSSTYVGHSVIQDTPNRTRGESTPLNSAPIRWWGGRRGWADDWDNVLQQGQGTCNPHATNFSRYDELDGMKGMDFVHPAHGCLLASRELFVPGAAGPGAFLDEEICESFDGVGGGFTDPLAPGTSFAPMGMGSGFETEGIPVTRAVPVPMPVGSTRSRIRYGGLEYGEMKVGSPPVDRTLVLQKKMPDGLMRRGSCHFHSHGNTGEFASDGTVQEREVGHGIKRSRRFSDASIHSSASYASCGSGRSWSQSQSLLASSSQSHTSTLPPLSSLGIGIEEAEREQLRSRSYWGRRSSGSTIKQQSKDLSRGTGGHSDDPCQEFRLDSQRADDGTESQEMESKQSPRHVQKKEILKYGSMFFRGGAKEGVSQDDTQREGYNRAEKYVSLAITSILPATTIAKLSPVGEALIRTRESIKFVGHELAPVVKDVLVVSTEVLAFAPLPGLEEAAKSLLSVWNACQKVDTNRLSCLRLAERCATLLYSVRCDVNETGLDTGLALVEPVDRLCGALAQIQTFLETQLHRPFLGRYVRREEIARELVACNEAITDAASRFGISVQIRTFHESRRFAQEAHAMLLFDHQIIRMLLQGQPAQAWQREVALGLSKENALGLTMDSASAKVDGSIDGIAFEEVAGGSKCFTTPPTYGSPLQPAPPTMTSRLSAMGKLVTALSEDEPGKNTPTSSTLSTGHPSDTMNAAVSLPPTPTPTRASFIVETKTEKAITMKTETVDTHPTPPIRALVQMHSAQDTVDANADEAALRGRLEGALNARNDVEMVRCLQVARGEIPEAAETLRRMLGADGEAGMDRNALEGEVHHKDNAGAELHRKFMQSGIEAMTRLASIVAKQPQDEDGQAEVNEGASVVGASELPSWTITRYEVNRTRKIGIGFFSDVYLGHWQNRSVAIKVLAHCVSREVFVRHVESWNTLDHPNVLSLYGASSAMGEKPWFFVSKFCTGGNLVESLKRAEVGEIVVGNGTTVRVDPLRYMYEIAKGMAYLHGCGVLHGDLRAANVLVDEDGQCILSDFGQHEIRSEAHRSSGQREQRPLQWKAPEVLDGDDRLTNAVDIYAFAMCCVEILGMGDLPWPTLHDRAIRELVLEKDERPPIPVPAQYAEVASTITNLVRSCWDREPNHRPPFSSIAASLEGILGLRGNGSPRIRHPSTPLVNTGAILPPSTESSPADEQYETASESMTTQVEEEDTSVMMHIPLTSPTPVVNTAGSVLQVSASEHAEIFMQVSSVFLEPHDKRTPMPTRTNSLSSDARNEENYRLIVRSSHAFHSSLTLPLWSPTRVELGAVGYLSKPKGEFITLFNAIDPLQSSEERLRSLPSMYGYGKFEIQKREDGKRSVAQRGLDAISGFLTFKARNDRPHAERIARQYTFPLEQGKPAAHLCVEKTVHRYMDQLEAPMTWFSQHVDLILAVCGPHHPIQREDLILVTGTLDAPDWALFVSEEYFDGRGQFNVFAGREKGEPWGMHTVERAVRSGNAGSARWMDVGQGTFSSKVSRVGQDVGGDTVLLAGLWFDQGTQTPVVL